MPTAPTNSPLTVHLNLGPRSYDVLIGSVANDTGAHIRKVLPNSTSAVLVVDPALPPQHINTISNSLRSHNFTVHIIHPFITTTTHQNHQPPTPDLSESSREGPGQATWHSTEHNKTLDAVESILTQLAEKNLSRTDPVISLGGGILGDLAGFAAATYRRGVPWINIPTTLLSMVDASVGGKTGANLHTNHALLKNMVGAFHQPKLVLIDPAFLLTLSPRELAAGFAECIKHAKITNCVGNTNSGIAQSSNAPLAPTHPLSFQSVQSALTAFKSLSATNTVAFNTASSFIHANVSLKASIVEQDEFETSTASTNRMLLNLGHTFAHALESVSIEIRNPINPTSPINHGEAVALGLVAASATAAAMNLIPQSDIATLKSLLQQVPLPTSIQSLPPNPRMIDLMHADKKTIGTTLRVILPTSDSTAAVFSNPPTTALEAGWNAIRA